jgi:hypothetical protein
MIKGNAMDVYTVQFADGDKFSLIARDSSMARLTALELVPDATIVAVHKIDQWDDERGEDHA